MGHNKNLYTTDAEAFAIAAEEQDMPFVEEVRSMSNSLTYVPASQPGPHYLESGKRPEGDNPDVIVQLLGGVRLPACYRSRTDAFFADEVNPIVSIPVCWWHLPQPVPNEEIKWFKAQFKPTLLYNVPYANERHNERMGWSATINGRRIEAERGCDFVKMYNHWVDSGRPQ